jgi:hypothetical protein
MHTTSLVSLSFLFHVYFVFALKFPFEARTVKRAGRLQGRASINGQTITNTHNAEYISNITLGGRTIPVMLDTGRYVVCVSTSHNFDLTRRQLRFVGHRVCPGFDRYWQVGDIVICCWTGCRFVQAIYDSFLHPAHLSTFRSYQHCHFDIRQLHCR